MFLKAVEDKEMKDIVNKCKNKTSIDFNETDMTGVKRPIDGISKPLTYICSSSLQTGIFPNKMNIFKVKGSVECQTGLFKNRNHSFACELIDIMS